MSSGEQKRNSAPSSGNTTPKLQHHSGTQSPCHQHSLSDAESGVSKVSLNDSLGFAQEFLSEITDEYDSMEDDILGAKEMLLHLQEMVRLYSEPNH